MKDAARPAKITVIIAVYNGHATLARCLDSVLGQSYGERELIVIDGGSSDGSAELLATYGDRLTYWESQPDRGIFHAWNKGLEHATGEWICFLGADDYFCSNDALARLAPALSGAYPSSRIVYGRVAVVNGRDELLYVVGEPWPHVAERFLQCMCIPHPGLMHHRSLFQDLGMFDESYRIAGDYELLLRELQSKPACFVDDALPMVGMQVGGISSRPEQSLLQLREVRRAQQSQGLSRPGVHWLAAMARVYLRLLLWRVAGETLTRRALDIGRKLQGKPPFWTRTWS